MRIRLLSLPLGLILLAACSQLQQTGTALAENNGVLQDGEVRSLGQRRYQVRVTGSTVLFDGQAEQFFRRRAEGVSQKMGCRSWRMLEYRSGTENTFLGARQYAEGVIECL
ncbi:hypothetical protein [Chitinimonas sp.]|uniref:hypothetical protein n=1 Tax=Chitinimonas sp. TaxID=1934313 RepID=UPI002F921952